MSTKTKPNTATLLDRAYGYALGRGNRDWITLFAGVEDGQDPERALRKKLCDMSFNWWDVAVKGVESPSYVWEGDWDFVSLEVLDDGRLQVDCGPELRTDDNVPFLKDLNRAARHDLMRAYNEMHEEEVIEYLEEDIEWGTLRRYPGYSNQRLDFMWYDLIGPIERNSDLEVVNPEDIGALTDNHTMISDEIDRTDHGDVVSCGRVYYYDNYMLRDPIMELLTKGRITLNVT